VAIPLVQFARLEGAFDAGSLVFGEADLQVGEARVELADEEGYQVGAQGGEDAQAQYPAERVLEGLGRLGQPCGVGQDAARLLHDLLARGGEEHLAAVLVQQWNPQLLLELLDLPREGGLAHATAEGSLAEVSKLRKGDQVFEIS